MPLSRRSLLALLPATLLAGCGFQLRGSSANLPYKTLYLQLPDNNEVRLWLERYIRAGGGTQLVTDPRMADGVFQQLQDSRNKAVLTVNAQGRVREYRLFLNYAFQVVNSKGLVIVPRNEISLSRDITFDDSNVLAKDMEEGLLFRDMNNDLVNQIMRRLSIVKPKTPGEE